jgi:hypothetical protein
MVNWNMSQQQTVAWYKQFWPWFLIALPGSVVIASVVTIIIAVQNPDSIVIDDYYKAGLAINRNLSREQLAIDLDIKSALQFNNDNKQVRIIIEAGEHARPQTLQLKLMHPTLPDKDQSITLERSDSLSYSGKIDSVTPGVWNVVIESASPSWRIQRRIDIDSTDRHYQIR